MRIAQIGLGPLGIALAADIAPRRVGSIAAAVDPAHAGGRLRSLVANAPDIPIAASLDDLDLGSLDAAIVSTVSNLEQAADTIRPLLKAGLTVVSTCEPLVFPWLQHNALAEELDALAREHGGRLMGTGVNPGFVMDTLPTCLSAVCRSIRSITIERIQDATDRREPFQRKIGSGLDREGFSAAFKEGWLGHAGLGESAAFVAHELGLGRDRISESLEMVPADRALEWKGGQIKPGQAAGVRQVATVEKDGAVVARLIFQAAIGQAQPRDRIHIDGEPPIELIIPGCVHGDQATIGITLNALAWLAYAAPGLHSMASIPMVRGRMPRPA